MRTPTGSGGVPALLIIAAQSAAGLRHAHHPNPLKEDEMSDMREDMLERLALQRTSRRERSQALWKMSREERVAAMHRGELTWGQLYEWASRAGHEVPRLNGEYWFIAAKTPKAAEAEDPRR
jgi:hypothetical protein